MPAKEGYELGFRTFVLQGGEDGFFTEEKLVRLIQKIRKGYPDCAITLSVGEKTKTNIRGYGKQGQIAIFFVMKQQIQIIIDCFILKDFRLLVEKSVFLH